MDWSSWNYFRILILLDRSSAKWYIRFYYRLSYVNHIGFFFFNLNFHQKWREELFEQKEAFPVEQNFP